MLYALNRLGAIDGEQPENQYAAERLYNECLALAKEIGNREREATTLYNLGIVSWSRGDFDRAISLTEAGLEIDRDLGMPESIAYDLNLLAHLHLESGKLQDAWRTLQEALALAQSQGAPPVFLAIIWGYAGLLAATGDVERSLELFGMLRNHPAAHLTEFPFYIDREIAKLKLDPVFVDTHMARGAGLRLEDVLAEIQAYPGPP